MNATDTKTRPALFEIRRDFTEDGSPRVYRITEPASSKVVDASGGKDPGSCRPGVIAQIQLPSSYAPADTAGQFLVRVRGMSSHGNATTWRWFDTLEEADRYVRRWAARRWRVAVVNGFKLSVRRGRYVMTGGLHGEHSVDIASTDRHRLAAHWAGYTELRNAHRIDHEQRTEAACLSGASLKIMDAPLAEDITDAEIWKHITAPVVDGFAGRVFSHDPTGRCGWSHFRVVSAGRKPGTVRMRRVTKSGTTQKTVVVWPVESFKSLQKAVESRTA